ncbi:MAG: hypothetical protein ACJ749_12045 [Flavisolibacter sp.]
MKSVLICICLVFVFSSCKKEQDSFCIDAVVKWGGAPELDGIGWYLKMESDSSIAYKPENLPDDFKQDGLKVNSCMYETGKKFYCMCAYPMAFFHISSIKKR